MHIVLLALALLALLVSGTVRAETIKLAIGDWEPYTSPTNPKGKILERIVAEAFKQEGVTVQYSYFPWKRSYEATLSGELDGTFPWIRSDEREKQFVWHKVPLMREEGVYFHLKSKPFSWSALDDLKKYKVGVTIGYKDEAMYKEKGIPAEAVPSEDMNFRKMLGGRIDVYQTSKTVGYITINKTFTKEEASQFTHDPKPAEVSDYWLIFSKKSPKSASLADKLDAGLKKIKASGQYDKIMAEAISN